MKSKSMGNNQGNRQILYGGIISYALIIINVVLGLVYTPWILKEIGSSDYGLYTLAVSLIALLLMDFGMSAAVTRFVAMYRAQERYEQISRFVSTIVKLYLLIMFVIAAIMVGIFLNIDSIYKNLTPSELQKFKIVFALTAFCVVVCFPVNICNGILNSYEKYIALKLSDMFSRIGMVIVTVIALMNHGGLLELVAIHQGFSVLTFLLKIYIVHKLTDIRIDWKYFNLREMGEAVSFSAWTTVTSVAQQMIFNVMPSILAMVLNTMAITLYGFANVIEGYIYTITSVINGMLLPRVSKIVVSSADAKNVLQLMIKVGRINQSIVNILFIGITVLGYEFIDVWVGGEYRELYLCILLLASPYLLSSSQQIAANVVIALNKVKYTAIINIVTGVMNVVLAYLFAPEVGVIGVCGFIALTYWLRQILNNALYRYMLNIDIRSFFTQCHLQMLPSFLLSMVLGGLVIQLWPWHFNILGGWAEFGIKVLVVSVLYLMIMWLICWNEDEKKMLMSLVKR